MIKEIVQIHNGARREEGEGEEEEGGEGGYSEMHREDTVEIQ